MFRHIITLLAVLHMTACGVYLGRGGDPSCDKEWREADDLNAKANAPEGQCNLCGSKVCPDNIDGLWIAERVETGKREPGADATCRLLWHSPESDELGTARELCEPL